jgi:hypothetical protein
LKISPRAGAVVQVVEHLPCKYEALNSNPSISNKKKKKKKKRRRKYHQESTGY